MQKISNLTPQQEALLTPYKKKWQLKALSTEVIHKQKAVQTIEAIYKYLGLVKKFDVYFFDSPACIANLSFLSKIYPTENWDNPKKLNNLIRRVENQLLRKYVDDRIFRQIELPLINIVGNQIDIELWHYLENKLHFWSPLHLLIIPNLRDKEKSSPIWKSAQPNKQERLEGLWIRLASGLFTPDTNATKLSILDSLKLL